MTKKFRGQTSESSSSGRHQREETVYGSSLRSAVFPSPANRRSFDSGAQKQACLRSGWQFL